MFFSDWAHTDIKKHLPFLYNVVPQATYSYLPAFRRFGSQTKICHFIGAFKPWDCSYNESTGQPVSSASTYYDDNFLSLWWQRFVSSVLPLLSLPNAKPGLEAKLKEDSQVSETDATVEVVSEARWSEQSFSSNLLERVMPQLKGTSLVGGENHPVKSLEERQTDWEHGDIDYLGADSFEKIRKHLDSEIGENSSRQRNTPPAKSLTTTKAKPLKSALKKGSMFADSSP
ncbi:GYG1 [Bugula neritina]|uniref:GYG1 n=1 Tax=Bugula neritina TaxID=10212 RepID=A0A7J7IZ14_BUGNE|nr:GYG1 [Bugula neritina]